MPNKMNLLLISFCLFSFPSLVLADTAEEQYHLDSTPDIDGWGFDIGFGQQTYSEDFVRLGILSPQLFGRSRLVLDVISQKLLGFNDDPMAEYDLSIEFDGKLYKDIVYSYSKLGLGLMIFDDTLYDGSVFTVPIAFGFNTIAANTKNGILSFFVEYRYSIYRDYNDSKSRLLIAEEAIFDDVTSFGLRWIF